MYLLIPLILILASALGILFVVWRKIPRLKELAEAESNSTAAESPNGASASWQTLAYDLCPEVWNWARGIKVKEYKELWLVETEKLLRRLRVASQRMDRLSDSLIKKIRKHSNPGSNGGAAFTVADANKDKTDAKEKENEQEELKKSEQKLILEIARNPKNTALYEKLGDLYAKAGDYRDAKEAYEAAIELNSNNEELKKKLSQALEKLNKPEGSQG